MRSRGEIRVLGATRADLELDLAQTFLGIHVSAYCGPVP